jgi:hypothetical protein
VDLIGEVDQPLRRRLPAFDPTELERGSEMTRALHAIVLVKDDHGPG